jgi:hypothetical protein
MDIVTSAYNVLANYAFGRHAEEGQLGEVSWDTDLWCWAKNTKDLETAVDVAASVVVLDARTYQSMVKGA